MGQAEPGLRRGLSWGGEPSSPLGLRPASLHLGSPPHPPDQPAFPTPSPPLPWASHGMLWCPVLMATLHSLHGSLTHTRVPMHWLFPGARSRSAVALRSALVPGVGPTTQLGPENTLPDG